MFEGNAGDFSLRGKLVQPRLGRRAGNGAHNAIGKTLGLDLTAGFHQAHGGINRRMGLHAGIENLIRAQAQGINHSWRNGFEAARGAFCDDGIYYAEGAEGAVGDLGGKGGVSPGELLLTQCCGQDEVGKGIVIAHPTHDVESHRTRRVHTSGQCSLNQTAFLALAGTLTRSMSLSTSAVAVTSTMLLLVRAATTAFRSTGFPGVLRLAFRRLITRFTTGTETTTHWNFTSASLPSPRAQSAAFIIFLPGGWILPSWTGCVAVPTKTAFFAM